MLLLRRTQSLPNKLSLTSCSSAAALHCFTLVHIPWTFLDRHRWHRQNPIDPGGPSILKAHPAASPVARAESRMQSKPKGGSAALLLCWSYTSACIYTCSVSRSCSKICTYSQTKDLIRPRETLKHALWRKPVLQLAKPRACFNFASLRDMTEATMPNP